MTRSILRFSVGTAVAIASILGGLGPSRATRAADPLAAGDVQPPDQVHLTFEEPQVAGGSIIVAIDAVGVDEEPIARQPIDFAVVPDFFGERPLPLQTALTNAEGKATITYSPTWDGDHKVTASFAGNEDLRPSQIVAVLTVTGVPAILPEEAAPLESVHHWGAPGAVAITLAVWLILVLILGRVGWGIWRAGHRSGSTTAPLGSPRAGRDLRHSTQP